MGLDMYLYRSHYVENWEHDKEKFEVKVTKDGKPLRGLDESKVKFIKEEVAYWRKANAIHAWFVGLAGGEDECQVIDVSKDQLKELLAKCHEILDKAKVGPGKVSVGKRLQGGEFVDIEEDGLTILNPDDIRDILPPCAGFFFGATDLDDWYLEQFRETIRQVEPLTSDGSDASYEYQASW